MRKWSTFLAGLLMGLASTGLILLLIRQPRQYPIQLLPPPTSGPLSVHVAGAAERPGVYNLPRGSIVQDALDAAGGPTSSADLDRVNLPADLEDGQRVYIPQITASGSSTGEEVLLSAIDPDQMININTAGAAELELLPGIGPSLAKEIMDHLPANGLFNTADDLLAESGVGPAKVEQIRDLITFH
ncbi:MAG: ComEA family DNA-binding protein [Anaerolineales bacterium]|nr:ComEA family DNA-binding protein [Anaerolineales bacterium]